MQPFSGRRKGRVRFFIAYLQMVSFVQFAPMVVKYRCKRRWKPDWSEEWYREKRDSKQIEIGAVFAGSEGKGDSGIQEPNRTRHPGLHGRNSDRAKKKCEL